MAQESTKRTRKSCIFGCNKLDAHIHRFPHPINHHEWYSSWVAIVGDKLKDDDPMKIYNNKRVCDYHFKSEEITAGRRVVYGAIPSLNLSGVFEPKYFIQREHNYPSFTPIIADRPCDERSVWCNIQSSLETDVTQEVHETTLVKDLKSKVKTDGQPSTSQMYLFPDFTRILSAFGFQDRTFKQNISNLKKKVSQLQRKNKNCSKKCSNGVALQQVLKKMTPAGKTFTRIQYSQSFKKSKGRRFSLDGKILSLTLYKKSPKCYFMLSKYFTLPNAKTLKKLLSQVKIGPGINEILFKLKGFVSYNSNNTLADHVLVFMIKGIKKNYKQPVAYYFSQSLKKFELKSIITHVVTNVQQTGIIILCTVCDQSTIIVSTLNSHINDTKHQYLKQGREWRNDIFRN